MERNIAIDKLKVCELSWSEYYNSLTPEQTELERISSAGRTKKWYYTRRDQKLQYCKEYREKNRERINARDTAEYICETCKSKITWRSKTKHEKTEKHKQALQNT